MWCLCFWINVACTFPGHGPCRLRIEQFWCQSGPSSLLTLNTRSILSTTASRNFCFLSAKSVIVYLLWELVMHSLNVVDMSILQGTGHTRCFNIWNFFWEKLPQCNANINPFAAIITKRAETPPLLFCKAFKYSCSFSSISLPSKIFLPLSSSWFPMVLQSIKYLISSPFYSLKYASLIDWFTDCFFAAYMKKKPCAACKVSLFPNLHMLRTSVALKRSTKQVI